MASNLSEAVLFQGHAAAMRGEKSYLEILTPNQTILFQEWLSNNKDRLSQKMSHRRLNASSQAASADYACLMDVCQKLEEVLRISKTRPST